MKRIFLALAAAATLVPLTSAGGYGLWVGALSVTRPVGQPVALALSFVPGHRYTKPGRGYSRVQRGQESQTGNDFIKGRHHSDRHHGDGRA